MPVESLGPNGCVITRGPLKVRARQVRAVEDRVVVARSEGLEPQPSNP